jgi:hypothetical protein
MRLALCLLPAAWVFTAACASQPAFKPVATVQQLMHATVHPAAEVLFDSVGTIISLTGVEEIAPKNEEEWDNVRNNALTLAESGNLLMMAGRARDQQSWIKMSQALIDAGMRAVKAAEAKDPEALFDAGGAVYEVCQQCHELYWKN